MSLQTSPANPHGFLIFCPDRPKTVLCQFHLFPSCSVQVTQPHLRITHSSSDITVGIIFLSPNLVAYHLLPRPQKTLSGASFGYSHSVMSFITMCNIVLLLLHMNNMSTVLICPYTTLDPFNSCYHLKYSFTLLSGYVPPCLVFSGVYGLQCHTHSMFQGSVYFYVLLLYAFLNVDICIGGSTSHISSPIHALCISLSC